MEALAMCRLANKKELPGSHRKMLPGSVYNAAAVVCGCMSIRSLVPYRYAW